MFGIPTNEMADYARLVESLGVDGIAIPDHANMPTKVESPYPYGKPADRSTGFGVNMDFPDPWVCIGSMASVTSTIRFATHVTVVPVLHPFTLYRQAATAAVASNYRVDLGVGIGWMSEELEAMGVDFRTRASRTDESLDIIRELSRKQPLAWKGKRYSFEEVTVSPVIDGPLPIIVGGESPAALRRSARIGDGWVGAKVNPEEMAILIEDLRVELDKVGRDIDNSSLRPTARSADPERSSGAGRSRRRSNHAA
jgi:probable F420-dependent oxidoreductase